MGVKLVPADKPFPHLLFRSPHARQDSPPHPSPLPTPGCRSLSPPSTTARCCFAHFRLVLPWALFSTLEPERTLKPNAARASPRCLSDHGSPSRGMNPSTIPSLSPRTHFFPLPRPQLLPCLLATAPGAPMTPAPESPGQGKEGPGGTARPSPHVISLPAHARLSGLRHRWPGSRGRSPHQGSEAGVGGER